MRLITWNCKGGYLKKHYLIAAHNPDIVVIPECEPLSTIPLLSDSKPVRSFQWFGGPSRKGVGVIATGEYSFELHPAYRPEHRWIVPLIVSGPISFVLFAVWTLPMGKARSYVQPLRDAFRDYEELLNDSETVWAGDFNAGVALDKPSYPFKFREFLTGMNHRGYESLYHRQRQCVHGEERDQTYFHYHHADKGFFLDYVFASETLLPRGFQLSVGDHSEWAKYSDHMPVIVDLPSPTPAIQKNTV